MKKTMLVILAIVMTISMIGCGKSNPVVPETIPTVICNIDGTNYTVTKVSDKEYTISNITNMDASNFPVINEYYCYITTTVSVEQKQANNLSPIYMMIYANDIPSTTISVENSNLVGKSDAISKLVPITSINIKVEYLDNNGSTINYLPFTISQISFVKN